MSNNARKLDDGATSDISPEERARFRVQDCREELMIHGICGLLTVLTAAVAFSGLIVASAGTSLDPELAGWLVGIGTWPMLLVGISEDNRWGRGARRMMLGGSILAWLGLASIGSDHIIIGLAMAAIGATGASIGAVVALVRSTCEMSRWTRWLPEGRPERSPMPTN